MNRWLAVGLCGVGLAIGAWFATDALHGSPQPQNQITGADRSESNTPSPGGHTSPGDSGLSADALPDLGEPDHSIAESGRLSIDSATFREGAVLTFELALADEAHGRDPLEVRVVSVDGRVLDLTTESSGANSNGVRLAIDTDWLLPGRYMIQLETTEKTAFPVRRYVLEVQ